MQLNLSRLLSGFKRSLFRLLSIAHKMMQPLFLAGISKVYLSLLFRLNQSFYVGVQERRINTRSPIFLGFLIFIVADPTALCKPSQLPLPQRVSCYELIPMSSYFHRVKYTSLWPAGSLIARFFHLVLRAKISAEPLKQTSRLKILV